MGQRDLVWPRANESRQHLAKIGIERVQRLSSRLGPLDRQSSRYENRIRRRTERSGVEINPIPSKRKKIADLVPVRVLSERNPPAGFQRGGRGGDPTPPEGERTERCRAQEFAFGEAVSSHGGEPMPPPAE